MIEQLDLFSLEFEYEPAPAPEMEFNIGDRVKVKGMSEVGSELSIEDEVVLSHMGGRKGTVIGIHRGTKATTYEVEFAKNDSTYFYSRELILLG